MRTQTRRIAAGVVAVVAMALLASAARADDPLKLMPESASAEADEIDSLTYLILWITGVTFVGVEALLVAFLFKYRKRGGAKAKFTHGNHAVEMVWTVTPALILVFLALYQMSMWVRLKRPRPENNQGATEIQVVAKQFEWNFRYAGPDGKFGTADDRLTGAAVVVPVNKPVNVTLRSLDVIHSFYLPNFRFKQDAVPGLTIPFWFKPTKLSKDREPLTGRDEEANKQGAEKWVQKKVPYWDIVCAELCGNLHTSMGAQLYVVTEAEYEAWLKDPNAVPAGYPEGWTDFPKWTVWDKANPMAARDAIWARWEWQDKQFDDKGRILMRRAKLNREPFGQDDPLGGATETEDM